MKRVKRVKIAISLILTILFMLCLTIKTDALCTTKKYSDLKMTAYKSTVSYDLKFDEYHNYYFLLTVNNVEENIFVKFDGHIYEPDKNGVVELPEKVYGGETYEVYLYAGYDTACAEEYLYTKRITVPKYNVYSERDECIEYEEFYLCNKWYAGKIINEEDFLNRLDSYIQSLKKKSTDIPKTNNKGIIQQIIDFYTDNKIITIPITVLIILFVLYKVVIRIIRRRNRIKLNNK